MRLSEDKARRLTALVWRDRAKRWLPVAAIVVTLTVAFTFYFGGQLARVDRTVDLREIDGTVTGVKPGGNARGAAVLHVHLEDGRDVDAFTNFRVMPPKGAHVIVAEARHASGRMTYDVLRLVEQ
jgi:hypothetical protein